MVSCWGALLWLWTVISPVSPVSSHAEELFGDPFYKDTNATMEAHLMTPSLNNITLGLAFLCEFWTQTFNPLHKCCDPV